MARKILVSPGYGAGWSTWSYDGDEARRFFLTYAPIIEAIEAGQPVGWDESRGADPIVPDSPMARFVADFTEKFGEKPGYLGGARDLMVITVDTPFRVTEYDGSESVEFFDTSLYTDPDTL